MAFEPVKVALPQKAPGLLRSYAVSQRNLLELIPETALTAPILSGRTGVRWHLVMAPEAVGHVMQSHVDNYPKSEMTRLLLEPALGDSILLAEGESWRRQRRAAAPAFAPRNVAALGPVMEAAAQAMTARITPAPGRAQDLLEDCVRATFDIISDTTFSGGGGMDRAAVMAALEVYLQETGRLSFLDVLGAPNWVPRPGRMKKSDKLQHMIDIADARIVERRQSGASAPPDLLDLLLEGEDAGLSDVDVRDNLLTFIIAGHETTAITLAWALYLLGNDIQVQDRAREEVRGVLKGAPIASAEQIRAMPYLRQVLDETLRLYPAAAFLSRQAVKADEICGTAIAPGDTVSVPIYAIHRHRTLWDNPDAFDPDRWSNGTPVPRFGYLPFGDGPRICIGMSFAYQEALIVLASLLAQYCFTAVPGKSPKPEQLITLRPTGGVWLTVEAV